MKCLIKIEIWTSVTTIEVLNLLMITQKISISIHWCFINSVKSSAIIFYLQIRLRFVLELNFRAGHFAIWLNFLTIDLSKAELKIVMRLWKYHFTLLKRIIMMIASARLCIFKWKLITVWYSELAMLILYFENLWLLSLLFVIIRVRQIFCFFGKNNHNEWWRSEEIFFTRL